MKGLKLFGIALSIAAVSAAFASGWTVSVTNSSGVFFPPSTQTNVPFIINTSDPLFSPATVVVNTLPQVTFLTAQGNPPILAGDGTSFTGGTYTAAYTITGGPQLTGFNFVVSGYVYELGQIIWTKKVVDINTSQMLYNGSGVFSGAGYARRQQRGCQLLELHPARAPIGECAGHRDLHRAYRWRARAGYLDRLAIASGAGLGTRACKHARAECGAGRTAATPTREKVILML
jgi:hypothetical protein